MDALRLTQDMQGGFVNRDEPSLIALTHIYLEYPAEIVQIPVSVSNGYGCALNKPATFAERVERFVQIVRTSRDTLKRLYSISSDEISTWLFLYDLGVLKATNEDRVRAESEGQHMVLCLKTIELFQEAVVKERLGSAVDNFIVNLPLFYRYIHEGQPIKGPIDTTAMIIAGNIIALDKEAIESIQIRYEALRPAQ